MYIPYKGRSVNLDSKVDVYRCLNRKGKVYSVRQNGLVVAHTTEIKLQNVDFIINNSGKQRAIKTMERNVHAFIRGFVCQSPSGLRFTSEFVYYNPYDEYGFVTEDKKEYKHATLVQINEHGVYAEK